ncbi:hypothetical protein [Taibaiella helva]|uniref:hypothetical protein n=1 Tax=Taibaiella helva TaxID=2301235 RepID=UPI000E575E9D|nr:hypothetical protein [Taibaiella helva]
MKRYLISEKLVFMKFWNGFGTFWIIYLLFFAIGLPLVIHYAGDHHQSDYQMIHTSAGKAFILLGVGTVLWFIVFIYYIKQFLINLLFIGIDRRVVKQNAKTIVLTVVGLLLLIALAAGILVYTYIYESRGYGWRYLYFWHPYILIPGSFIFYFGLLLGAKGVFSKYLGKVVKP